MQHFENGDRYILKDRDKSILCAARQLLSKIMDDEIADDEQLMVMFDVFNVLDQIPNCSPGSEVLVELCGPRRWYGEHEIWHWWNIQISDQCIEISSGGHFYRQSTGGDSFTCMRWMAQPGYETEFEDYLPNLRIVDDAQPFEDEVACIDFHEPGYTLTVTVDGEVVGNDDENETDELDAQLQFGGLDSQLDKFANLKRALEEKQTCNAPSKCDLCGQSLGAMKYFIDGKLSNDNAWANMCEKCFTKQGAGIGWGVGQLFMRQPDGKWLLVGGFPS